MPMLHKHHFLIMIMLSCILSTRATDETSISHLSTAASLFELIDGVPFPFGIDYHYYGLMRIMEKNFNGILNGDAKHPGYEYQGTLYSLNQLVALEAECTSELIQAALRKALQAVKDDVERTISPFLDCARRSPKGPILHLMRASCELHNTPNSFMLTWAEAEEGNEFVAFRKEITSLLALQTFLIDQINFLKYMIANCPKAHKQYIEKAHKKLADIHVKS